MKKRSVLIIMGTRPEAIKLAPVIMAFQKDSLFKTEVCVTAQHRSMMDQVLKVFGIKPKFDLNLMKDNQDLFDISSLAMIGLKKVLDSFNPDVIVVQGDTTTSMVAALSAFYRKIPIVHVEAGLRTHNKYEPFPEEINRCLTSRLADLHFAPTSLAKKKLLDEGIDRRKVFVTGNTVIDALHWVVNNIKKYNQVPKAFKHCDFIHNQKMVLITLHRRENFGEGLKNICAAIRILAQIYPHVDFVYPVHLNPNVQDPVKKILSKQKNVHLIVPQPYSEFIYLMFKSYFIITDSGGIQEEVPSLGKPALVTRNVTERREAVDTGVVRLVGTNKKLIIKTCKKLIEDPKFYKSMIRKKNPYGDGKASEKIVLHTKNFLITGEKSKPKQKKNL